MTRELIVLWGGFCFNEGVNVMILSIITYVYSYLYNHACI